MSNQQVDYDLYAKKDRDKAKADGVRLACAMVLEDATKDTDGTVTTGMWIFRKLRRLAKKIERGEA